MTFTTSLLVSLLAAGAIAAPVVNDQTSSAKRGLAYNDANFTVQLASSPKMGWGYNWGTSSGGSPSSIEFVPTLKSPSSDVNAVSAAVNNGAKSLLTYNEPDQPVSNGGCSTSPQAAAASWASTMGPLAGRVAIGSPAVTSDNKTVGPTGGPSGLVWLQDFVKALGGGDNSHVSFVPLHWYGDAGQDGAAQAASFQKYIQSASDFVNQIFGKPMPLWVTEFSPLPLGDQKTATDFMDAALPFLDGFDPVAKYAFYMACPGNLVNDAMSLTPAGTRYNS